MIAYNKMGTWTLALQPFPLPQTFPQHLACALEGTLNTGNKRLLISCNLPQYHVCHAESCIALNTFTSKYPNHQIIIGGDFQGDWTSTSTNRVTSKYSPTPGFRAHGYPHLHQHNTPKKQRVQAIFLCMNLSTQPSKHTLRKRVLTHSWITTVLKQRYTSPW
jgi:hypothetical protein